MSRRSDNTEKRACTSLAQNPHGYTTISLEPMNGLERLACRLRNIFLELLWPNLIFLQSRDAQTGMPAHLR
jgi:hypothetical protein